MSASRPRRLLLQRGAASAVAAMLGARASSQTAGTLRILTAAPAGGTPDFVARRYAERFAAREGGEVRVDNRPGAAGMIAISALRQSAPDGKTVLMLHGGAVTTYPHLYAQPAYDPVADLLPVSLAADIGLTLAIGPSVAAQVREMRGLMAWARAPGSAVSYGSPGVGTLPHLLGAILFGDAGIDAQHVPYVGVPPAVVDLVAGRLSLLILPEGLLRPHRFAPGVRVLATFGASRSATQPEVPCVGELGFGALVAHEWLGWFMPRRTPPPMVQARAEASRAAAGEVSMALAEAGIATLTSSPAELADRIAEETRQWATRIARTGIRL